jgi:hypothetical protein
MAAAVGICTVALCAGVAVSAIPAYADVSSANYTIGTPTSGVSSVTATPSSVVANGSTSFEVSFTASAPLSGASDSYISVAASENLGSVPTSIDIVGGSCIQAGTAGTGGAGTALTAGITIELGSSCTINAGQTVQVYFTADAPTTSGTFYFTVTTSNNSTQVTSNTVTVGASASSLSAVSYGFGTNTTYTISGVPVQNLSGSATTLTLQAFITAGTELLSFYNGAAGYSVSVTPSGGSATADPVQSAVVAGGLATLTLENSLASGDTLNITATGSNPAASGATQSNEIRVTPGNGTPQTTNAITFGNSVTSATLTPSSTLAGAATTYTVTFKASTAVPVGGDMVLSETAGPTNFATVTGIEVSDANQGWHYVASGAVLASGTATIPVSDAISAGDSITLTIANVTNPSAATISDFKVSTSGDDVAVAVAPYTIGASASSPVTVTVSPATTSALATYTITNLVASAALTGGSNTISVQAPSGTVFPNNPSYYTVSDGTTPSGSGTATTVTGGGTDDVTITVPNSINSGDKLSITIEDVINPSVASSTDSISLTGNVTGLAPTPTTTTTTTAPTTTTTAPKPKPAVKDLTAAILVVKRSVSLKFSCGGAACSGQVVLTDVKTEVGHSKFSLGAGKTGWVKIGLFTDGLGFIAHAKKHTITVTATITVTGGATVKDKVNLVG